MVDDQVVEHLEGFIGWFNHDYPKVVAEIERRAVEKERERIREALAQHWPFEVICSHSTKTDVVICSCSRWNSGDRASVGDAIACWIEHVFEADAIRRGEV